jgi:hypothetical protein
MPEGSAVITSLILDRPLCLDCIAMRSPVTGTKDAEKHLGRIAEVMRLRRERAGRCRACGAVAEVFSIDRPPL